MKALFDQVSAKCSKLTTHHYSTSFSLGIKCLDKPLRDPICGIYGFVRLADEIVDSFHDYDKPNLLKRFKVETHQAIEEGISLNPILNSFQHVVNTYNVDKILIDQFLFSMEMDLSKIEYNTKNYEEYILGSAEVVGLMCLKVFCNGNQEQYDHLKPYAMKLGSAFQKINFLRDLKDDYVTLGRSYFPGVELNNFNQAHKEEIERDIESEFKMALTGIKKLPRSSKFGVYLAYIYYYSLFKKIKKTPSTQVMKQRIRIPNPQKISLLFYTYLRHRLNIL
ncbi:phytoene/squalene synthase family protein [Fulvivirga sediminis]|uniref:Phytoene/squalene synthase family protein n=1 Tax=Fulvivirga sediminis TaxID=2803949 RepID=A0A937K1G7_9BACT|nr:phytoene/squalene synthase family protein [Fulvivirga sediminis]MBL3657461.1 phytoene/squalene synthase family protein [Fulvivirga sediminis]